MAGFDDEFDDEEFEDDEYEIIDYDDDDFLEDKHLLEDVEVGIEKAWKTTFKVVWVVTEIRQR